MACVMKHKELHGVFAYWLVRLVYIWLAVYSGCNLHTWLLLVQTMSVCTRVLAVKTLFPVQHLVKHATV